jgi:DNA-binding PadR family transcriptional regulator
VLADRGTAEPARHALLGLLLLGPRHGYDLARSFAPTRALGNVIHLSASHLYSLLGRLERGGFIVGELQEAGARPPRLVYQLTDVGRHAVLQWIDTPVRHPRDMLITFPVKLYIAQLVDPQQAMKLIAQQRAVFVAYVQYLEQKPYLGVADEDADWFALMRAGRIGRARGAIEWLDGSAAPMLARPT